MNEPHMETVILIKYGEIALKRGNREKFEKILIRNIKEKLTGKAETQITRTWGRLFIHCKRENLKIIISDIQKTFGIVGFGIALVPEKNLDAIKEASRVVSKDYIKRNKSTFKAEVKRVDKKFPYTSYDIACEIGDYILKTFENTKVDVHNPDWQINVEVREKVYVYAEVFKGPGGLPVGASGKGLLLLSGGIDSPVAGFMMSKRGLSIDAIYFHSPPYTSQMALEKVKKLSKILKQYNQNLKLVIVPFTEIQERIKERANAHDITLMMRAAMIKIADKVARKNDFQSLITGESLGQVASQTIESIRFTDNMTNIPIFRPLIGMDKEEIIAIARKINTFDTSIQPYDDCCTLFAPKHPTVHPIYSKISKDYKDLELEELIESAVEQINMFIP